uniref:Uncharacterized protein n=1 Tax=Anguilla anguilla TaxID=7936 RepID=A0A0E9X7I0_ANGAN
MVTRAFYTIFIMQNMIKINRTVQKKTNKKKTYKTVLVQHVYRDIFCKQQITPCQSLY